MLTTKIQSTRE